MKTSNTSTVSVRKKTSQNNTPRLYLLLVVTILLYILASLLYEQNYIWNIGIIAVSIGAIRIYSWYTELLNFEWSIELAEISMEDVIADLENHSPECLQPIVSKKKVKTERTERVDIREELVFSSSLESMCSSN